MNGMTEESGCGGYRMRQTRCCFLIGACGMIKLPALVLDSAALFKPSGLNNLAEEFFTTPRVIAEIKDEQARMAMLSLPFELNIRTPDHASVEFVMGFSKKTGDISALSLTDIQVIALAYMLENQMNPNNTLRTSPPQAVTQVGGKKKDKEVLPGWFTPPPSTKNASTPESVPSLTSSNAKEPLITSITAITTSLDKIALTAGTDNDSSVDVVASSLEQDSEEISEFESGCCVGDDAVDCDTENDEAYRDHFAEESDDVISDGENYDEDSIGESDSGGLGEDFDGDSLKHEDFQEDLHDETVISIETGIDADNSFTSPSQPSALSSCSIPMNSLDEGDEDTWVTPKNIRKNLQKIQATSQLKPSSMVSCFTLDYAMQNVLLQIGLNLVSMDGMRIKSLKKWILRCHACYNVETDATKQFCTRCGKNSLMRTCCSVDADGSIRYYLKRNFQYKLRGSIYPIPKLKGGRNGGMIFCEDEIAYMRARKKVDRERKKELTEDLFDADAITPVRARATASVVIGAGRKNRNESRRKR